jgi:hypothetical protein
MTEGQRVWCPAIANPTRHDVAPSDSHGNLCDGRIPGPERWQTGKRFLRRESPSGDHFRGNRVDAGWVPAYSDNSCPAGR